MERALKEIAFRKRRREMLIDIIKDLVHEGVLKKQIAIKLGMENTRISKILNGDIYISEEKVETYLTKLGQGQN